MTVIKQVTNYRLWVDGKAKTLTIITGDSIDVANKFIFKFVSREELKNFIAVIRAAEEEGAVDEETGVVLNLELLDKLDMKRKDKLENIALYIEELKGVAGLIKDKANAMRERADAKLNKAQRLAVINDTDSRGVNLIGKSNCSKIDLYSCYKGLKKLVSELENQNPVLNIFEAADMLEGKSEEEDDASSN